MLHFGSQHLASAMLVLLPLVQLAFRRDLEKVIDEAVNASVEKIEKAEGPRFTVQVMRTCLLTITKGEAAARDRSMQCICCGVKTQSSSIALVSQWQVRL